MSWLRLAGTTLFIFAAGLALAASLLYVVMDDLPIVRFSAATRLCVSVDDPAGHASCARLPARYHHVWVE